MVRSSNNDTTRAPSPYCSTKACKTSHRLHQNACKYPMVFTSKCFGSLVVSLLSHAPKYKHCTARGGLASSRSRSLSPWALVFQTTNFVCLPLVSSLFLVARSSLLFLVRYLCLQARRSLAAGSMKRFVVGCSGGEELSMKGLMSSPLLSLYLFTCTIFSVCLSLRTCATTLQLQA